LENVEAEAFEKIVEDVESWPGLVKRWQEDTRGRLRRWRNRDFSTGKKPVNEAEYRGEEDFARYPNLTTEGEALIGWMKWIDRSNPRLKMLACPPVHHDQRRVLESR